MPRTLAPALALGCALLALEARADRRPTPNAKCSPAQRRIAAQVEASAGKSARAHVQRHFTPKGSYLVTDYVYQNFVKGKPKLGRPSGADSFLFVAGGKFIDGVLRAARKPDGTTDFAVIEKKLGLPSGTYKPDGGLWRVDVNVPISCYRLPKADDPGANSDFKPGGFTSGGVPEILVINGRARHALNVVKKGPQKPAAPKGGGSGGKAPRKGRRS